MTIKLSKSKFVAGCQCLKRLYLQVHEPELAAEPDECGRRDHRAGARGRHDCPPVVSGRNGVRLYPASFISTGDKG